MKNSQFEKKSLFRILLVIAFMSFKINLAQKFPPNFAGVQIATKLDPVGMDLAPDGRIFLAEKPGRIRIIENDVMLTTPLITIPNVDNNSERGLMKVAVDNNFATNGYIYAFYTRKSGGVINNRVSRFTVVGNTAAVSSEFVIVDIDPVDGDTGFHNGGGLVVKDNQIYIATGESTVTSNSQTLSNLKGKILRFNTDGSIPTDNPYYTRTTGKNRAIICLGFRNPFNLSKQRTTGRIFCTEVGSDRFEEVNEIILGRNYGWPGIEGFVAGQTQPANYQDPFFAYSRSNGACSITAGTFYNPENVTFPTTYENKYFYGDYCAGWIKTLDLTTKTTANFATEIERPLDMLVNKNGVFYFIERGPGDNTSSVNGKLWKVTYTGSGVPVIAVQPSDVTVSIGQNHTFKVNASGNPVPTYQWQKNGVNIPGANQNTYTVVNPALADSGSKYSVVVSNSVGSVTSRQAVLTVINNDAPVPKIISPINNSTYEGGMVINFSGSATDKEDGDLPASAFTWSVDLYHFDDPAHFHPTLAPTTGVKSGTFTIPRDMETSPNVLFRIYLTVKDSKGAEKTIFVDIKPIIATIDLSTQPEGLKLKIDGVEVTTPYNFKGAKGINRIIEAPSPQTIGGVTYAFNFWSDNGAQSHTISTPGNATNYKANFIKAEPDGIVSGYVYEMEPQHAIGQRLNVIGGGVNNGTLLDMMNSNAGSKQQQFKFISKGNGLYVIEPQNAIGKVIGVVGNSTANNALIEIETNGNKTSQTWKSFPVANEPGLYRFEPQNALGNRLDIELLNGVQSAASRTLDTGNSQKWRLIPIPTQLNTPISLNEEDKFYSFPNPFTNKTYIAFPLNNDSSKRSIAIFNIQGQLIQNIDISKNETGKIIFERNNLQSGIYIYSLMINDSIKYSKKMIIK